ncbi:antibiotic biosynthesis monooxygenase [Xanthomonas sp. AmX2]|uniref:antibiotic biosynthesis monooxygenase n=1 Tax=Xanthomonas sp. TaxID=29446 RepID=UPI00197DDB7A|nr:antibiotic biosynthesis monooxygenase [Xanthomonas sp.]MBN6151394.1 antibiotic biosynthesis monooxygenase [Xanthomonas sp.]
MRADLAFPLPCPDAHAVLVTTAPASQCAGAIAALQRQACGPWLHALAWLRSIDAAHDLLYLQCRHDPDAAGAALRALLAAPAMAPIGQAYRRVRSGVSDPRRLPGCIVVTTLATADTAQARRHGDAAFAAMQDGAHALRGLIASHLHLADDARSLLEYAEWTSDDAYRRALQRDPKRLPLAHLPTATTQRYRLHEVFRPGISAAALRRRA